MLGPHLEEPGVVGVAPSAGAGRGDQRPSDGRDDQQRRQPDQQFDEGHRGEQDKDRADRKSAQ
jgi:hypothetical protein